MTENTTTDEEAPPKEEESEPDPRKEATQALLEKLREVFDRNFGDQLEEACFDIVQEEEDEEKERWEVRLRSARSEGLDSNGEEKGKYQLLLDPQSGGESAKEEKIYLKVVREEGGKIELKVRGGVQGKWKTFNLINIFIADGNPQVEDAKVPLKYGNKGKFSQSENVFDVWFPRSDRDENETLQIPVHMKSDIGGNMSEEMPDHWGKFYNEGLKVVLPNIQIERKEEDNEFNVVDIGSEAAWRYVGLSFLMYWVICNVYAGKGTLRQDGQLPDGFPSLEKYRPRRPVNLDPATVINQLESEDRDDKLYFPWHVIESACSALNAGKNVIFTGPPGCGKSKLASFLAERATGQEPLMTTASPAWSTGDLIGRYMPAREGRGLVFQEGVFLRALGDTDERSRWLVIDEFNRADIDSCFGELFSVLAGDVAELPFEKENESEEDIPEGKTSDAHPVRIVPEGEKDAEKDADYLVPDKFRLIGTMNDADRSGLNNLSFALMRRFAIIHVESPNSDRVRKIIDDNITETENDLKLESYAWNLRERGGDAERCKLGSIKNENKHDDKDDNKYDGSIEEELKFLFAASNGESGQGFENLVSNGVVGVSVIGDVIRFVGEGIRGGNHKPKKPDSLKKKVEINRKSSKWAENLTLSYLALGTVLQVFPQLEALGMGSSQEKDKLSKAIQHIFEAFHIGKEYSAEKLLMLRVKKDKDEENKYILESEETIGEFLFRNLKTRFPRQAESWKDDLRQYLPDENTNEGESP